MEKKDSYEKDGTIYYASKDKAQSVIEFSRYKQDCRKRALDLAQSQSIHMGEYFERNKIGDGENITLKTIVEQNVLTDLADKYYNWLISIPQ